MVDLWFMQSYRYIDVALEEGVRQFSWHVAPLIKSGREIFSWVRANTAAYGPVRIMLIDHSGAAEYSSYGRYDKPLAVYPTWDPAEPLDELIDMLENPPGEDPKLYDNENIPSEFRPVKGQKHRVVIHRITSDPDKRMFLLLELRDLQKNYPNAEIFIGGAVPFNLVFGMDFKAAEVMPINVSVTDMFTNRVQLPTGKQLANDNIFDRRYADWFSLIGVNQFELNSNTERTIACVRSLRWAALHFHNATPFITTAGGKTSTAWYNKNFVGSEFYLVSDKSFVLPASRRRLMRNLGINPDEYDKFTCDTCILHNACTLYRKGSVCGVKGTDAMALADSFGSRNAEVIIGGLLQIAKRNAERLEDAMAVEQSSGELDPEVTKLGKTLFDQGVKLAKLIDPTLAGGPKVQVNVGVGQGGQANVGIQGGDPKQLMATVVAELEAQGIPRSEIDSDMVKGVLRNMAQVGQQQAITTAVAKHEVKKNGPRQIEGTVS